MYEPPLFREDRVDVMQALMHAHPFATLVSSATGTLSADHVPLELCAELSKHGVLRGHLAVANPLYRGTDGPISVLAVFQGPQSYITPSWYPSKQEHGKVVPTWNYAVVHATGQLRFHTDPAWLMAHLTSLTQRHEAPRDAPWEVADAPGDFTKRQLKGLVGFEIDIEALTGKWKVSQNKAAPDRAGVEKGLLTENTPSGTAMSRLVGGVTR
ncbi:MAG: FMN-binding negative transcriptional regulator [Pseudomonadota bacterium]